MSDDTPGGRLRPAAAAVPLSKAPAGPPRAPRINLAAPTLGSTRRRLGGTFLWFVLPLLLLGVRLTYLQGFHGGETHLPDFVKEKEQILPARRADILACDGTAIAVTVDEYAVCANPRAIAQKAKVARVIAENIGGNEATYLALLNKTTHADGGPNYYVRLARHVDEARIEKLRKRMGPPPGKESARAKLRRKEFWAPITLAPTPRRTYPMGNFASQLVGFTAGKGGASGLELSFNKMLGGKPGEVTSQVDAHDRPVPGYVEEMTPAVSGHTLVTTIDPQIQADADSFIGDLVAKYKPNFAVAIVMRPQTGEVLAMSTAPAFDPNNRPKNIADLATNRCTRYAYEPGSTFKMITASAAIENVADWRSHHFYCNGVQLVGHHQMHCWINSTSKRRHGDENLADSIRDSCNFGMYGFARLVGAPTMLAYAKNFGLHSSIDIPGLGGPNGYLARNNPNDWSPEQLANFSFGQGMTLTPLQLARVVCTIANDGVMMKPMIVREVRDEQNKVVRAFAPQVDHRVIKATTAHIVRDMMERVLSEGSASKSAWVPGYRAAGKTGSAQKADGVHGYATGKFISSLVGFIPSHQPRYAILVMADEPHGSHWGSEVCGPAWSGIARRAMLHLRLRDGASAPAPDPHLMTAPGKKPGEH